MAKRTISTNDVVKAEDGAFQLKSLGKAWKDFIVSSASCKPRFQFSFSSSNDGRNCIQEERFKEQGYTLSTLHESVFSQCAVYEYNAKRDHVLIRAETLEEALAVFKVVSGTLQAA